MDALTKSQISKINGINTHTKKMGFGNKIQELIENEIISVEEIKSELVDIPNKLKEKPRGISYTNLGNLMRYTDKPENAFFNKTATIDASTKKTIDGIVLTKVTSSNFYNNITCQSGGGIVLDPSKKYLCSCYVQTDEIPFFFFRKDVASNVNESFYVDNKMRRIKFFLTGANYVWWYVQGQTDFKTKVGTTYTNTFFIGGFQIEEISANPKNAIAFIGDSTVQGSAGTNDVMNNVEWSKLVGSLLSCGFYNRGIGGNQTQDMINRWVTDMTPLAQYCKYAVIQGGINDLGKAGVTAETIKANLTNLRNKAMADGFEPIMCTITPCNKTGADETTRTTVNTWLLTTFEKVLDLDKVVRDPVDHSKLNQNVNWVGDGVHYALTAKIAVANYIVKTDLFKFVEPNEYVKVDD